MQPKLSAISKDDGKLVKTPTYTAALIAGMHNLYFFVILQTTSKSVAES